MSEIQLLASHFPKLQAMALVMYNPDQSPETPFKGSLFVYDSFEERSTPLNGVATMLN